MPDEITRPLPAYAMGYKEKWWPNGKILSVCVDDKSVIEFVMACAKTWEAHANLYFNYVDDWTSAAIRISTKSTDGSWSYIGTDNEKIPAPHPTMNLGWIHADIRSNKKETTLHELGHSIGLGHEHQNPNQPFDWNETNVIRDLSGPPNYWDISMIRHNVLDRIKIDQVDATTLDRNSIMMYWFPDTWVKSGAGTKQNTDLSELDKQFISLIYPKIKAKETEPIEKFIRQLCYDRKRLYYFNNQQLVIICLTLGIKIKGNESNTVLRVLVSEYLKL